MSFHPSYEHEFHQMRDPDLPVIFHQDDLEKGHSILAHWHANLEVLWFISGHGMVVIDGAELRAKPGDLVIIDSNRMHRIVALETICYNCLIIDRDFCRRFGFPVGEVSLRRKTDNLYLRSCYERIAYEIEGERPYYKAAVQANVLRLLSRLYRSLTDGENPADTAAGAPDNQYAIVRDAISFLNRAYDRPLTVDEICGEVGFSKYYFCRVFRSVTGKTVVDYLNLLRCEKAQTLLASGMCNVRESAERCGFRSNSYFSKIYKKQIGELPSDTMQKRGQDA